MTQNKTSKTKSKSKRYIKHKPKFPKFPKEKYHEISKNEIMIIMSKLRGLTDRLYTNEPVRAYIIAEELKDYLERFGGKRYR